MKTMKTMKLLAVLFVSSIIFTGCSDDDDLGPDDGDGEELITTVTYTLSSSNNTVILKFTDIDGEGGSDGTYSVDGSLMANTLYTGAIKLENETESPIENITEEIKEEDDEHEFFYTSSISGLIITKTDKDDNGNDVGIETTLETGSAGAGTISVILKHEPTKPNDGTSADAGGSTDIEVTFNVSVQ